MKTTKYIFLALLAALLLLVPNNGRAETNTLKLVVDPTATILGLDCSDPTNQATILNLLFDASTVTEYTGSGKTVDDDGTKYVFELTTNGDNDIVPTDITEDITLATGANYASPTFRGTYKGEKITITIDKNGGDGAEHTVMIKGYTNSYVLTIDYNPTQTSATEQNAGLKVTGGSTGTSEYTSSSTPSITDLFDVTGSIVATSTDDAPRVIMLDGKQGQIYHGKSIPLIWSPTTQVKLPVYDWDGNTTGVISNEADYTKSVAAGNPLIIPFTFNSAYYGKLATFTFTNDYDAGTTYIPSAQSFDVATNTWTFTLPDAARAMISKATFTVTKRLLADADGFVSAGLTGYTSKEGDVYIYEYNGSDITPTIVLTDADRNNYTLLLTTDYTTSGDVTKQDPGLYTITLTGAGHNYTGTREIKWRIAKNINHSDFTVTVDPAVYTGTEFDLDAIKSKVVVKHNGTTLTEGATEDYTLAFKTGHVACKDAKTYVEELVITGNPEKGIIGSRFADFTINPKDIALCDITAEAPYDNGNPIDPGKNDGATPPTYDFITVKDGATTLVATVDFTVTVNPDTYVDAKTYDDAITITAVPGGNYVGSKVADFTITGGTSMDAASITITVDPVVYRGTAYPIDEVKAKVVVKDGTTTLVEGTHYDLTTISTYLDAKTYTNDIVITGKGTYYGTRYADFIVQPKPITLCDVTATAVYTGSAIDPAKNDGATPPVYDFITVKDGATDLVATVDFTVAVAAGTYQDAGTYDDAITITAVDGGNYTGFQIVDFVISHDGFDVAKALVEAKDVYTGAALPPVASNPAQPTDNIKVTLNDVVLKYGVDYTFIKHEADANYLEAKTYENAITIKGMGEYYGELETAYVIQPRAFADADVTITVPDLNYNDADQAPVPEVKYLTNVVAVANYTFTPATVKEAGTYTLNFEGQYSLTGTKTAEVKVLKALDGAYTDQFVITIVPDQPLAYDGVNPVEPEIKVTDNGKELVEGTDYTVAYTDNTAEGEGTVTITGAGVYSGTKTLKFPIVAEYFTEGDFSYHYISSTTVAVGTAAHDAATTPPTDGQVVVPDKVTHTIGTTPYDFDVVGVEEGAFKALTTMLTLTLPTTIEYIEDKTFEGCSALRWIDAHTADNFTPSSLDRTIQATPFYGVPAQALIFLTDNTVEGENYIYYVNASEYRCAEFKIYDDVSGQQTNFATINGVEGHEWAYENPYEFKANKVTNTRQFIGNQHYTTCLPYPLAIPANMKAYQLEATSETGSATMLAGFTEVTGTLQAFQPYVLIPTVSGQLLSAGETTVPVTTYTEAEASKLNKTPASTATDNYYMFGCMRFKKGDGKQYIMQKDNVWKLTDGMGWNSGNGACILPMRAYLALTADAAVKPQYIQANYTDIFEMKDLSDEIQPADNTDRYDLSGRKVTNGNLRKGIYIVNGKKVVMGK